MRDKKKFEELKSKVPQEKLNELKNFTFERNTSYGKNIYVGTGLIAGIIQNEKNVKINLMFFNEARQEFYTQTAKLTIEEFNKKNYKQSDYVQCKMKYDKEMYIYEFKAII